MLSTKDNDTLFISTKTKIVIACFSIHNFCQQVSVADRLFYEYDIEEELESDSNNQNQGSATNNFFTATDQKFMLQFRDHITNKLFQVFN